MARIALEAVTRKDFGKGAARRLRREGLIPAVVYGTTTETVHIALNGHDLKKALKKRAGLVLDITVDGTTFQTVARDVQKDYVRDEIEHLDLIVIDDATVAARLATD
jgi:large subunit ribosomal protein L25